MSQQMNSKTESVVLSNMYFVRTLVDTSRANICIQLFKKVQRIAITVQIVIALFWDKTGCKKGPVFSFLAGIFLEPSWSKGFFLELSNLGWIQFIPINYLTWKKAALIKTVQLKINIMFVQQTNNFCITPTSRLFIEKKCKDIPEHRTFKSLISSWRYVQQIELDELLSGSQVVNACSLQHQTSCHKTWHAPSFIFHN